MLGYVNVPGRGKIDDLLCTLAEELAQRGKRVAGAVQRNGPDQGNVPCEMYLNLLNDDRAIRISQSLGPHASGCRLDPHALVSAVGEVEASLNAENPPDLLIVNKFGRQEADGGGFRSAIGAALVREIPTLVGVRDGYQAELETWAGDLAEQVTEDQLLGWCLKAIGAN